MAGEANTAHDVHFEELLPGVVGFVKETDGFVDAQVVNQNVDVGQLANGFGTAGGCPVVGGQRDQMRVGQAGAYFRDGLLHTGWRAAVDYDGCAFGGQRTGDFLTDAAGGGGDQSDFVFQIEFHWVGFSFLGFIGRCPTDLNEVLRAAQRTG